MESCLVAMPIDLEVAKVQDHRKELFVAKRGMIHLHMELSVVNLVVVVAAVDDVISTWIGSRKSKSQLQSRSPK